MSATTTDYSNKVKLEFERARSSTPISEDYTDSEDEEEGSQNLFSFSQIHLRDGDSNLLDSLNDAGMPTNFAEMKFDSLSSAIPSTSEHENRNPSDAINGIGNSNVGRKRTYSNSEFAPKETPAEKRTATKICRVCGDKAYSYNFNVITCESCKAFFRRNANKEKEIRCPFNDQCDINIVSRRFCQRCRLQKCFRVGMKKEWIMSEEARLEKKQRILDNRERRAAERLLEDKGQAVQASFDTNSNVATNIPNLNSNGDTTMTSLAPSQQNGVSQPNTAVEELAAAIAAPVTAVQQQAQAAAVAAAMLQSAAPVTAPVIPAVVPPVTLIPSPPQTVPQTSEVAQYAAAVAAATAAANAAAPATVAPSATFPTHNDAGQLATERALAASILTNVAKPPGRDLQAAQMVNPIAAVQLQQQVANYQAAQHVIAQAEAQAQAVNHIVQQQQAAAAAQQHQQQQAQNLAAAVAAAASIVRSLENSVTVPPPAMITSASIGSGSQLPSAPLAAPQMASPDESLKDLISVPRDIFIKLIENRMESDQCQNPLNPPPVKCQCRCNCGRYPNELLIVDKVMTDLLENSTKHNNTRPMAQLSQKIIKNSTPIPINTTPPLVQVQGPQAIMQPVQVPVTPSQQVAVAPSSLFTIQPMQTSQIQQVISAQQMRPMSAQQIQTVISQSMSGITNFAPMVTGIPNIHEPQPQPQQQEYMYHQTKSQPSSQT